MINPPDRDDWRYSITKWAPVLLWAALIFSFSTDQFSASHTSQILEPVLKWLYPGISPDWIDSVHFAVRKLGHVIEYIIFALLLLRALGKNSSRTNANYAALALFVVLLYAISDEFHQSFVVSRTATAGDVLIDLLGGICGTSWMLLRRKLRTPTPFFL
jgi:VanZ family protein